MYCDALAQPYPVRDRGRTNVWPSSIFLVKVGNGQHRRGAYATTFWHLLLTAPRKGSPFSATNARVRFREVRAAHCVPAKSQGHRQDEAAHCRHRKSPFHVGVLPPNRASCGYRMALIGLLTSETQIKLCEGKLRDLDEKEQREAEVSALQAAAFERRKIHDQMFGRDRTGASHAGGGGERQSYRHSERLSVGHDTSETGHWFAL